MDTPQPDRPALSRRARARRTVAAGLLILALSALLILSPLAWGRWDWNKYFVAFGLFGACLGATCAFNGGWDWLRGRDR